MTFRIETVARGRLKVFILSGRIEAQAIAELRRLLELQDPRPRRRHRSQGCNPRRSRGHAGSSWVARPTA